MLSAKKNPRMIWSILEMSIACPRCDSPVMVNGPFTTLNCPGCDEVIDFTPEIWADLLEDTRSAVLHMKVGEGSNSTIWGTYNTSVFYGRLAPYCKECKKDYNIQVDYSGTDTITCGDCGATRPVEKPPEWFNTVFKGVKLLIGVSREAHSSKPLTRDLYMSCPNCGASVKVSGSSRNEKCGHCNSSIILPGELWRHINPAPVKERWFVGFIG